jgi:hypothetical protein
MFGGLRSAERGTDLGGLRQLAGLKLLKRVGADTGFPFWRLGDAGCGGPVA